MKLVRKKSQKWLLSPWIIAFGSVIIESYEYRLLSQSRFPHQTRNTWLHNNPWFDCFEIEIDDDSSFLARFGTVKSTTSRRTYPHTVKNRNRTLSLSLVPNIASAPDSDIGDTTHHWTRTSKHWRRGLQITRTKEIRLSQNSQPNYRIHRRLTLRTWKKVGYRVERFCSNSLP